MVKLSIEEIKSLSDVYHELIFVHHQNKDKYFSNKFKGITSIEVSILEIVDKYPDIILREILEILRIPNSTLINAINRLEKKKLIRRVINNRDRRSFGLELTESSIEVQKEHKNDKKHLFQNMLIPLTAEERKEFISSLIKIAENFKNL